MVQTSVGDILYKNPRLKDVMPIYCNVFIELSPDVVIMVSATLDMSDVFNPLLPQLVPLGDLPPWGVAHLVPVM